MAVLSLPFLPSSLLARLPTLSSLNIQGLNVQGHPVRTLLLSLVLAYTVRTLSTWVYNVRNLPPGPPKHALMDNRGDMEFPLSQTYRSFRAWHEKYGAVVSFWLGRKGWVSLGTIQAATDLLEKRGAIYSSRPKAYVTGDILTRNMRGLGMPYGQRWRNWKQLMHASMNIEAAKGYRPLQDAESKLLLRDILQAKPEDWNSHLTFIRRYAVSVVTVVSYGRRIKDLDDHLVVAQDKMDQYFVLSSTPGKFLVDIFPILSYLPKPLQWWRAEPEARFQEDSKLLLKLMGEVRGRMEKGLAYTSTATRALEKQGAFGLNDLETAFALSAPFGAGAGTTLAQIDFFLLAMLHYPDTMAKAQAELDRVIGRDRLPEFDDMSSLPYLNALIKETMRWRTIAHMGVPHSLMEDDVYEGKVIPKGTTVIASIYTMTQNPEMFPEPDLFKPERYLDDPSLPYNFLFGFGRRLCPGMHVAQNSLFMVISKLLWAFDILPPVDSKTGKPILPDPHAFVGGIVIKPVPFDFVLRPREGKNVESVVLSEAGKAEVQLAAYD